MNKLALIAFILASFAMPAFAQDIPNGTECQGGPTVGCTGVAGGGNDIAGGGTRDEDGNLNTKGGDDGKGGWGEGSGLRDGPPNDDNN